MKKMEMQNEKMYSKFTSIAYEILVIVILSSLLLNHVTIFFHTGEWFMLLPISSHCIVLYLSWTKSIHLKIALILWSVLAIIIGAMGILALVLKGTIGDPEEDVIVNLIRVILGVMICIIAANEIDIIKAPGT